MEPTNPFPAQAVATYGTELKTNAELRYLNEAAAHLGEYLSSYDNPGRRYGAAVGLRGGHGSGKTHLLMWLAAQARGMRNIQAEVLYAKADKASFYDIYSQLMGELPREGVQRAIGYALKNIAINEVGRAKATESIQDRIKTPDDLPKLYDEEHIARDQLLQLLRGRLEETQVPEDIPRTLLQVDSPTLGAKAYQWLSGRDTAPPEELGLGRKLFEPRLADAEEQDATAVNALETVAALLNLADRPLIILIDQLEVVFSVQEQQRRESLYSAIKKLTEQLGRQNAMLFIAGTDDAWQSLRRDVSPRLRGRDPVGVGRLTDAEALLLLDSYTKQANVPGFSPTNAATIRQLAGGNPREIIGIAYQAFKALRGQLDQVDEHLLVQCAGESGSIADQQRLALSIAGTVLAEFGATHNDLSAEDGVVIDWLLLVDEVPLLALVTAKATDKISEVDSARRVQKARAYVEQKWPTARVVVVSVGYSSSEVGALLSRTSTVMEFDEDEFANRLRAKTAEVVTEAAARRRDGSRPDASLEKVLEKIASRLDQLEEKRTAEAAKGAEQFAEETYNLARPEREQREMRTRWDLLEALDALEETLNRGRESWGRGSLRVDRWVTERGLVKSILVSNETNLSIKNLEILCGYYQDLLSEERTFWLVLDRLEKSNNAKGDFDTGTPDFSAVPTNERRRDPRWIYSRILAARADLIHMMRTLLRGPSALSKWMDSPLRYSLVATGAVTFVWVLGWLLYALVDRPSSYSSDADSYLQYYITKYGFMTLFITKFLPAAMVTFAMSYGTLLLLKRFRTGNWAAKVREVRFLIRNYDAGDGTTGT